MFSSLKTETTATQCSFFDQHDIHQRRIGQSRDHCDLDGGHDLSGTDTESGEAEDAIVIHPNESLNKPARLGKRARTQVGFHRHFEQAIRNPLCLCFGLTQADMSEFGIGKQTVWNLPARSHAIAAG